MAQYYFDNINEAFEYLNQHTSIDVSDPLQHKFVNAILDKCQTKGRQDGFDLIVQRWVIRSGDLALVSLVKTALVSFASANFVLANLTSSGIVGITVSVFELLRNLYRNGSELNLLQLRIIMVLKSHSSPVTEHTLLCQLNDDANKTGLALNELEEALNSLREVPTRAGLIALVEVNRSKCWSLKDL